MTNEEAIKILNDYDINFERHTAEEVAEAHEMAIKALETQPCEDCISRDATLTAFSDYAGGGMSMNDFDAMWDIVVKMPPVEPKPKTSEDCISRKAVLDALHRYFAEGFNEDRWWNSTYVLDAINKAPSATPQPKERTEERTETHECDLEQIIKTTIKEYLDKDYDDVTELLLALSKDLCERIRKEK